MGAPIISKSTTTSNYEFLEESFIKARNGLIKEERLIKKGYSIDTLPNRLRGVGLEGGSRSGKTWDSCVFICNYLNTFKGKIIVIARDRLTRLKKTVYETLKKVWRIFGMPMGVFNKSATPIHYNDNVIYFVGIADDAMIAHGLESDLLWINEIMNIQQDTFDQLEQRCKGFWWCDYNPSATKSWVFDMEYRVDYKIHHTTIIQNEYAPLNSLRKILGYEPTHPDDRHLPMEERRPHPTNIERKTADLFKWQVYGEGQRAKSEDIIFPNYTLYTDEEEPKEYDWKRFGGDFGFDDDPSAFGYVIKNGNNIYIRELFRVWHYSNEMLAEAVKELKVENEIQAWDSAEKKSIFDLQKEGLTAVFARKGSDSVHYGIKRIKQYNIHVHKSCVEYIEEMDMYRWKKMANGEYVRNSFGHKVPIDLFNHGIDWTRYAITYFDFE